jgi:hypothetical protein
VVLGARRRCVLAKAEDSSYRSEVDEAGKAGGNDLLSIMGCSGRMYWKTTQEEELSIVFDLGVDKNGVGLIELNRSDSASVAPLSMLQHDNKTFSISAVDSSGASVEISEANIRDYSVRSGNLDHTYKVSASIVIRRMNIKFAEMFQPAEGEVRRQAVYFVKGLVKTLRFKTRQEPWEVWGNSEGEAESSNSVSAQLWMALDDGADVGPNFGEYCDELSRRLLEVLSVSVGTSLAWSIRKVFKAEEPIELFFVSTQVVEPPSYPLFHNLNLSPALELALERHTSMLRLAKGLDVAIYWYLNYSQRAEAYYLHLMTALEHMVSRHSEGKSKARFDKTKFKNVIRPALAVAAERLKEEAAISEPDLQALLGKLGDLNRLSLRDSLEVMLSEWGVRYEDLVEEVSLADLVDIRNDITHGGAIEDLEADGLEHFFRCLDTLVELLKRIFMSTWGYQGKYISHLGEYHEATYPPESADVEASQEA